MPSTAPDSTCAGFAQVVAAIRHKVTATLARRRQFDIDMFPPSAFDEHGGQKVAMFPVRRTRG
jgi:hypothetical protein